jgi:hypothetical protein
MLHLLRDSELEATPAPYAEAVSRLASVRHALRLVDGFGGGPASELPDDEEVAAAWDGVGEARQRCFDVRSSRAVGAAAAGIEAMLAERRAGREPNPMASQLLVEEIRRELRDIAGIVLG